VSDEEIADILQQIIELAYLLDFSTAAVQDPEGQLQGMYIGTPQWIMTKVGKSSDVTH